MNTEHVLAEWAMATNSLRAARLLHREELFADAVSRSYYAVMHAARAALLAHDTIAESHSAVRRLFGKVLVRPGLIEKKWALILSEEQEQDQRIEADYKTEITWVLETCQPLVQNAEAFVRRMRDYLLSLGYSIEDRENG